ncbi:hypothetical protein C8J56DRAFT_1101417 [Mycena floridula]|nr:hypothetical protein C8J56DRAFT_1101417 [Mycena floridula]
MTTIAAEIPIPTMADGTYTGFPEKSQHGYGSSGSCSGSFRLLFEECTWTSDTVYASIPWADIHQNPSDFYDIEHFKAPTPLNVPELINPLIVMTSSVSLKPVKKRYKKLRHGDDKEIQMEDIPMTPDPGLVNTLVILSAEPFLPPAQPNGGPNRSHLCGQHCDIVLDTSTVNPTMNLHRKIPRLSAPYGTLRKLEAPPMIKRKWFIWDAANVIELRLNKKISLPGMSAHHQH